MKISGCPCYDLIIVGSGLYGAVVARLAYERGKRVLVLERRKVVGGNCHDEWTDSICVHQHGEAKGSTNATRNVSAASILR